MKILLSAFLAASASASIADGALLYSVNFEEPKHQAGMPAATGGTAAPSRISQGEPVVRPAQGPASSQYLEFHRAGATAFGQEEIEFDIAVNVPRYRIQFDAIVDSLRPSLSTTEAFYIACYGDSWNDAISFGPGRNLVYNARKSSGVPLSGSTPSNVWAEDVLFRFSAEINIPEQRWRIRINGQPPGGSVTSYPFFTNPGEGMRMIEISLFDSSPYGDSSVRIDNILIEAVPEPSSICLMLALAIPMQVASACYRRKRA